MTPGTLVQAACTWCAEALGEFAGGSPFMTVVGSIISVLLITLLAIGMVLSYRAVARARREHIESRPISRAALMFNPAARILIEFAGAVAGFPGLGWLFSGKIVIGVALLSIVPSFAWALLPAYSIFSGGLVADPFATVRYLPVLAACSAGSLAVVHLAAVGPSGRRIS